MGTKGMGSPAALSLCSKGGHVDRVSLAVTLQASDHGSEHRAVDAQEESHSFCHKWEVKSGEKAPEMVTFEQGFEDWMEVPKIDRWGAFRLVEAMWTWLQER